MTDHEHSCDKENMIHQLLKVQAQVKVKPLVKHGIPKVYCVDSCIRPHLSRCHEASNGFGGFDDDYNDGCASLSDHNCNFTLTQLIRVEIPISFDVDVDIKKGVTCCGNPEIDSGCMHENKEGINKNPAYILMNNKIPF